MGWNRQLVASALLSLFALLYWLGPSHAQVPQALEIGHYAAPDDFRKRGYGVLLRQGDQCLVVTLSHVAALTDNDEDFDAVTARLTPTEEATVDYVLHNQRDDLYVGRVSADSSLYKMCDVAQDIEEYYQEYRLSLQQMLVKDFQSLELHRAPDVVELRPESEKVLIEALRNEPIRYRLADCPQRAGSCDAPVQGMSGSLVSTSVGGGNRVWLGLHQRACSKDCPPNSDLWQAVSVMSIYDFFHSPAFPPKSFSAERTEKVAPRSEERKVDQSKVEAPIDFAREVQIELARLKCEPGMIDGSWGRKSADALQRFAKAYSVVLPSTDPNGRLLDSLKATTAKDCTPICSEGQKLQNGVCKAIRAVTPTPTKRVPQRANVEKPSACIHINGRLACP